MALSTNLTVKGTLHDTNLEEMSSNDMVSWIMKTDFTGLINLFAYTGFNPLDERKRLMRPRENMKDISIVLAYYLKWGTNYDKHLKKMDKLRLGILVNSCRRLGVVLKPSSSLRGLEKLNPTRLASCFPDICSTILFKNKHLVKCETGDCPYWLCFPQGATLIKSGTETETKWKLWNERFQEMIKLQDRKPEVIEAAKKIVKAQLASNMFSDDEKDSFVNGEFMKRCKTADEH